MNTDVRRMVQQARDSLDDLAQRGYDTPDHELSAIAQHLDEALALPDNDVEQDRMYAEAAGKGEA